MTDGLKWIGQHTFEPPTRGGMRGGIALTAIRGIPVDELLLRLKARPDEISDPVAYRDLSMSADVSHLTPCMYGTSGDWAYVLEHADSCTWYEWWFEDESAVAPGIGEELVCIHPNVSVNPSKLVYSPGDSTVHLIDFGDPLLQGDEQDTTGRLAVLNEGLVSAGAVPPGWPGNGSVPQWRAQLDAEQGGLHGLVWQTVGEILGINVPRADVEQGRLPVALLEGPYA
ncbi:hypothetical protein [Streptomyces salinarius]|uniref:hypothetical protein n=1 Tax=Streptomyces salinarius TaxID=2762598 RepID=UPI0013D9D051|nr:hypothetical protein [Streptomyces salinarius]